jgi:hypothetical protein
MRRFLSGVKEKAPVFIVAKRRLDVRETLVDRTIRKLEGEAFGQTPEAKGPEGTSDAVSTKVTSGSGTQPVTPTSRSISDIQGKMKSLLKQDEG